jgi:diacylglycerol kinase (ATP)
MADNLRDAEGHGNDPRAEVRERDAESSRFSLAGRVRSFGFAAAGLGLMLRSEHNAWIHALATLLVLALAIVFPISGLEWCLLALAIALVWSAEAMNTALELLADSVSPGHHPLVGQAKDVAAGAVLVAALGASVVGLIVLGPHCLAFLRGGPAA